MVTKILPILYYAIVRTHYYNDFNVMKVTSEKSNQIFGSLLRDGIGVHFRNDVIIAKFDNVETAKKCKTELETLWNAFDDELKRARIAITNIERDRKNSIAEYIKQMTMEKVS